MRIVEDITNFIFVNDEPRQADIIFLPGGSYPEPSERAAALWRAGYAPRLVPSGLYSAKIGRFPGPRTKKDLYSGDYRTEAEFMKDVLIKNGVPDDVIFPEPRAGERGTVDNAFFTRELTDGLGFDIRTAIICCKSFHARRCLLTYTWAYPRTQFILCPAELPGRSRSDWHATPQGVETVMSELRKCGTYFVGQIPLFTTAE